MKLYFSTIFVFILLLVATITNGTFLLTNITFLVINSYAAVIISIIVILCCIGAIIEHVRERITNDMIDILNLHAKDNNKLHDDTITIIKWAYNYLCDVISSHENNIVDRVHSNTKLLFDTTHVKLNNNLIETHQVHEVLKEVFMLDASIAKDTKEIKETIELFMLDASIDNLRNSFNSTSTSHSTFKDLSKSLDEDCKGVLEITNEELLELHPELLDTVEEKVIPIVKEINKKRKK